MCLEIIGFFLKKNLRFIHLQQKDAWFYSYVSGHRAWCVHNSSSMFFHHSFLFFTIVLFPFRNIWYNKGYFLTLISHNQTSKYGHISMDFHLARESHNSWFSWYDDMHLLVSLLLIVSCPTSHQRKKKYYLDSYFTCQKIV